MRLPGSIAIVTLVAASAVGGPWSLRPVGAQSAAEPPRRGCIAFHRVHLEIAAGPLQTGIPAGFRVYPFPENDPKGQGVVVREVPDIGAGEVAAAYASIAAGGTEPVLTFRLNAAGARKLASLTRRNLGRAMAIVVDGRVIAAPLIREPILGGIAQVSGGFTTAEAAELASRLRSRSCPLPARRRG